MLAIMTLYHGPSQGHWSFVFAVNFEKCYVLIIVLIFFMSVIIITISIIYHFIFVTIFFIIISSSVVIIVSFFVLLLSPLCMFLRHAVVLVPYQRQKPFIIYFLCLFVIFVTNFQQIILLCIVASLIYSKF